MSKTTDHPDKKRNYDARSRRTRAEQERRDTRERVLAAARQRFLADGYAGTKMTDIASEAGVAIASVYRAGRSKADLIATILGEAAMVDDMSHSDAPWHHRPQFPQLAAETDPERQVYWMADRIADVLERVAPLWHALRDAASTDATAAAAMHSMLHQRAASFTVAIGLLPTERLRTSPSECADSLWAFSSPDTYLMLRTIRRWSRRRYRDWLRRTLVVQILTPVDSDSQN